MFLVDKLEVSTKQCLNPSYSCKVLFGIDYASTKQDLTFHFLKVGSMYSLLIIYQTRPDFSFPKSW